MFELDRRLVLSASASLALWPRLARGQGAEAYEFIGPLPGWKDARRDFGAVGDGRTDDTAALQRALSALVAEGDGGEALYIPAGRYRITRTLVLPRKAGREARGLNIQGEDPARTTLVWDGPRGGRMLEYGAWFSSLGRLSFDGGGTAGIALAHGSEFVTANEIVDCWFQDVEVGIEAGTPEHSGIAETTVLRGRFLRCSTAGASLRNFNSLDWWFWRCRFEDCGTGLTNVYGAGNFHAYDSVFLRSREADITIRNTGYLSFRDNLSIGSKAFFVARAVMAGAELTFQRNRIFDTVDVAAIRVGNLGPAIFLDNLIVSRPGQAGPAIQARSAISLAIGNRFSAAEAVALKTGSTILDQTRVPRQAVSAPPPVAPARRFTGPVTTIAPGTSAQAIQARIDALAKAGKPAAVYFSPVVHNIDRTLTVPARADLRLVGNGLAGMTRLNWTGAGAGPILRLAAPSRARLSGLTLGGASRGDGVEIASGGAQVWFEQTSANNSTDAGYLVEGGGVGQLVLRNINHAGNKTGLRARGRGAPIVILSGASSDNQISYDLADGARLLAQDIWYESSQRPLFMRLSGAADFTLNGSNIATPRRPTQSAVSFENFSGRAVFLGVVFTGVPETLAALSVAGAGAGSNLLAAGCQGQGEFFADGPNAGRFARLHGLTTTAGGGARPLPDRGSADPAWLRGMLELVRTPPPREVATVRLTRIFFDQCRIGARVSG